MDSFFSPIIYAFFDNEFQQVFDGVAKYYLESSQQCRESNHLDESPELPTEVA